MPSTDEARTVAAGATETQIHALGRLYPKDLYSLSHVALPFPLQDGLYGSEPGAERGFRRAARHGGGARRTRRADRGAETLMRASSNPFFDYTLANCIGSGPPQDGVSRPRAVSRNIMHDEAALTARKVATVLAA